MAKSFTNILGGIKSWLWLGLEWFKLLKHILHLMLTTQYSLEDVILYDAQQKIQGVLKLFWKENPLHTWMLAGSEKGVVGRGDVLGREE